MVASAKWTADGLMCWYQIFCVSWTPSCAIFRAMLVEWSRGAAPLKVRLVIWLRWIFESFLQVARPISDDYDFPSGCYSWEISNYHPKGIISLFRLTPCFFCFELIPKCSAKDGILHAFARFQVALTISISTSLILNTLYTEFFFEATTYHRK